MFKSHLTKKKICGFTSDERKDEFVLLLCSNAFDDLISYSLTYSNCAAVVLVGSANSISACNDKRIINVQSLDDLNGHRDFLVDRHILLCANLSDELAPLIAGISEQEYLNLHLDKIVLNQNDKMDGVPDGVIKKLNLLGYRDSVEVLNKKGIGQELVVFERPDYYYQIEKARFDRLSLLGGKSPRYSVCVCNYNMSDTLVRAMTSVCDQLNDDYEVLVIDDGSNDDSLHVLKELSERYDNFWYISLARDKNRRLGSTRNLSIRAACGEYVLIHIDADDVWKPYLQHLVKLFHNIEAAAGRDFLLVGQQTGIAKKELLLSYGPYENVYRCEDRNMMMKLAKEDLMLFMDYRVYRTRLSRPTKKKIVKVVTDICSQTMFDMRQNVSKMSIFRDYIKSLFIKSESTFRIRLFRLFISIPVFIASRFVPPIINEMTWEELRAYHQSHRGTYSELMTSLGGDPDISFFDGEVLDIFSHEIKLQGFKSSGD